MLWTFYPWYHIPTIIGILISISLSVIAYRWININGIRSTIAVILLAAWCSIGSVMEIASPTLAGKMFWVKVEYPGIVFISLAWFLLLLNYIGLSQLITKRKYILLMLIPIITIILQWTNEYHHLVYKSVWLTTEHNISSLAISYGPWFWLFSIYSYLLLASGFILCIRSMFFTSNLYRLQLFLYLLYAIFPCIISIVYILRIGPLPYFDFTPLAFTIAATVWLLVSLRFHFLQLTPKAHHLIIESIADGAIILDGQGRIVEINPACCQMIGCDPKSILEKRLIDLPGQWSQLASYYKITHNQSVLTTIMTDNDGEITYEARIMEIPTLSNHPSGKIILLRDYSERSKSEKRLQQLAFYDPLTGLPNRTLFYDRLEQALVRHRRYQTSTIIIFLDLDGFKQINDTYGHAGGDEILCQVSKRLEKHSRESDTVSRLGGDEFVILLNDLQDQDEWKSYVERLLDLFSQDFQVSENVLVTVTPSIGVAIASIHGETADDLMRYADLAMYQAKRDGGNTVAIQKLLV